MIFWFGVGVSQCTLKWIGCTPAGLHFSTLVLTEEYDSSVITGINKTPHKFSFYILQSNSFYVPTREYDRGRWYERRGTAWWLGSATAHLHHVGMRKHLRKVYLG